ncbi:MAG: ATP-dependent DNA ligase [Chloroflexota bacterium]|nr:ATP-dependent DNA ligase [Chloroflexota bacterium]MDQ5867005.1 ATP-dependent DNA ligase [Chloroflexota bacterium]
MDASRFTFHVSDAPFSDFARTADAVSATSKRLEKLAILAEYLAPLSDADLSVACRFLSGQPFPPSDDRTLNVGFSMASTVLIELSGVDPHEYGQLVVRLGDMGDVAERIMPPGPVEPGEPVTLQSALAAFEQLASTRGTGNKAVLLRSLLAKATPPEAKYLVKLVTGDMRMGLKESLVEEALARMAGLGVAEIQRVNMLVGDVGETALMSRHGRLAEATMRLFHPLKFMLATPAEKPADILAEARNRGETQLYVEDKYDGVRAQLHKQGERAELYSRTLDPVTNRFPEVTSALLALPHDAIFDGEIVALSGEIESRCLPFAALQKRMGRKTVSEALMAEVPVACMIFDLLYLDGEVLLDQPLSRRKALLAGLDLSYPLVRATSQLVPVEVFEEEARAEADEDVESVQEHPLDSMFNAARDRGNEGLMVKTTGSIYSPGKRGKAWLKVKRALATLDVVVTAVEWGHGKRRDMLSDYTFAVLGPEGNLLNVGKAYSGLTDAEIIEMTEWFKAHTVRDFGRVRLVEPLVVIEVAFDKIQPSARHKSGYALRFPRIVRLRPDKRPQDASTLEEVKAIAEA